MFRKESYNNNVIIFTHIQMQKKIIDLKFCQLAFEK